MFARLNVVTVAIALALPMVFASPTPALEARSEGPCNTGSVQCCNQYHNGGSPEAIQALSLAGIVAPITGLVGLKCSPLTAVGAGATSCNTQAVCCTENHFNGLIVVGCTPFNVAL